MTTPFQYTSTFTLDKAYLTECYEQTVVPQSMVQAYKKAMIFVIIGLALLYVPDTSAYLGSFFIGLGAVEAVSVRFARPWWVTRQLLGRSGNNAVKLTVDCDGIHIHSSFVDQQFNWQAIGQIQSTDKGIVLAVKGQRQYISAKVLTEEVIRYIREQHGLHKS